MSCIKSTLLEPIHGKITGFRVKLSKRISPTITGHLTLRTKDGLEESLQYQQASEPDDNLEVELIAVKKLQHIYEIGDNCEIDEYYKPEKRWDGETVYIIGGGASLEDFDFGRLKGKNTIGCNDAYLLGEEICKVCYFGDSGWYNLHHSPPEGHDLGEGLNGYNGDVMTCHRVCIQDPDVYVIQKKARGLYLNGCVGWGSNTGTSAINLAILFGAKKVVLLGYDMKLTSGENNWHINYKNKPNANIFDKFLTGMQDLVSDWEKKCPEVDIVNAELWPGASNMTLFAKVDVKDVL
jgi:hypothetical protein